MGRRRIEMKKIDCPRARLVTFSKRRQGLFKKAAALSRLCRVDVAAVVFSPGGKIFEFGEIPSLMDRYLTGHPSSSVDSNPSARQRCCSALSDIQSKLNMNVSSLSLTELEEYSRDLKKMKGDLLRCLEEKQPQLNQYPDDETTSLVQDLKGSYDTQNEGLGLIPEMMMSVNDHEDTWRMDGDCESSDMVMAEGELDSMLAEWMIGDDNCNLDFEGW